MTNDVLEKVLTDQPIVGTLSKTSERDIMSHSLAFSSDG
eukprot:CAMPEP_0185767282 /NCGR_PEP_ID=MMETSP1174-20130828/41871_1 /TAXON_ID=35687 /ORGANISM="Dictyocha speculum, Strain CCMP1381" /LENGTH=38 /DNA_ID= /DNA_START= /DNA_END= /DNA_ORIENTATION=